MSYIPHKKSEVKKMLKIIGLKSIEDLFSDIPAELKRVKFNLPSGLSQLELLRLAFKLAKKNSNPFDYLSFLGAGAYEHFIPALVDKIISLPGFLTAYTPYQAEASQGTLRAIFEYQSLVCKLTGLEVSNASLYDGASALAEAAFMALNITERKEILVARTLHPEYREVLKTSLSGLDVEISELPYLEGVTDLEKLKERISEKTAAVILQQPNFFGCLEEVEEAEKIIHQFGSLFIVSVNPLSLGLLKRPADYGVDIAVGEGQPLGIPLNFGGPYLGFLSCPMKWVRQIPGRLVSLAKDKERKTGFTLVLQTREQHIRRERASSNICTNSSLNAIAFSLFLSLLGAEGLRELAEENLQKANFARQKISEVSGFRPKFPSPHFNEFVIECSEDVKKLQKRLLEKKIIPGLALESFYPELKNCLLLCVTETKSKADIESLIKGLSGENNWENIKDKSLIFELPKPESFPKKPLEEILDRRFLSEEKLQIPKVGEREAEIHWTKNSELNYCIDSQFYPLGSCTMKLNPKENEVIASAPRFTLLHPYLPAEMTQGTLQILYETQKLLAEICGMSQFSLQPAAGAHGELASLLIIKAFHKKQGDFRNIILIPDSAHGTNPASASRAGFEVLTIKSNQEGEIDLEDLKRKTNERTAGLMITLPNTFGLFEKRILEITEIIHRAGGLVYMDGANLNALLGIVKPKDMGVDILHLNLHKTFSTPHGGGGPGSGPIGVVEKLTPFLPIPLVKEKDGKYFLDYDLPDSIGKVATFYGHVGVVLKAYLYLRTLGREGLKQVSRYAVLNANYLRVLLKEYYFLPYDRICMHEFVLSVAKQREKLGGESPAYLIAKRLLDYGFHAPTVNFPLIVAEALMIEPTETESKEVLDEFIRAMVAIRQEIEEHPELVREAPQTTPVKRIDQISADRNPILRWQ